MGIKHPVVTRATGPGAGAGQGVRRAPGPCGGGAAEWAGVWRGNGWGGGTAPAESWGWWSDSRNIKTTPTPPGLSPSRIDKIIPGVIGTVFSLGSGSAVRPGRGAHILRDSQCPQRHRVGLGGGVCGLSGSVAQRQSSEASAETQAPAQRAKREHGGGGGVGMGGALLKGLALSAGFLGSPVPVP